MLVVRDCTTGRHEHQLHRSTRAPITAHAHMQLNSMTPLHAPLMRPHEPFSRDVLLQYITSSSKLAFRKPWAL
jgi:hypothetical protein